MFKSFYANSCQTILLTYTFEYCGGERCGSSRGKMSHKPQYKHYLNIHFLKAVGSQSLFRFSFECIILIFEVETSREDNFTQLAWNIYSCANVNDAYSTNVWHAIGRVNNIKCGHIQPLFRSISLSLPLLSDPLNTDKQSPSLV